MKKILSVILILALCINVLPAYAIRGELYAEGGFASRFLSHTDDLTFKATLSNTSSTTKNAILFFAKYSDGNLQDVDIIHKENLKPGKTEIIETTSVFNNETDKVSAFLFDGFSKLVPLFRSDAILEEYESLFSTVLNKNLNTKVETSIPNADELSIRFPINIEFSYEADGGPVGGGGMLAEFEEGGPGEIYIKTAKQASEDIVLYKQFRTVRVIDPYGKVVCYYDFSEKDLESEEIILSVPEGPAGIWTISYTGGKGTSDLLTFGIPESSAWGVRGEMTFKFLPYTPREWFIYVPSKSTATKIKTRGYTAALTLYDENGTLLEETASPSEINKTTYYNYELPIENSDVVWSLKNSRSMGHQLTSETITFATGIPGLLCPTKEMALKLKGGTTESSDGILLGGEYQKRVREAMLRHKDDDLNVQLDFPSEIPSEIKNEDLDTEALFYGIYGGLSALQCGLEKQVLDCSSPYYGAFTGDENDFSVSYEGFDYGTRHTMGHTAGLAALSAVPTKLNPAYGNKTLMTRSLLAAFCHFAALSPDMMLREYSGSKTTFGPMGHVFFIYPALATGYGLLKDKLPTEEAELWRNGLALVGDKLANYTANQSNQWSCIVYGHLLTYRVTGEERFLSYFERAIDAFIKENKDYNGSFGQHASGYYLEHYAPSGSYQDLSLHNIAASYLDYRKLKNADDQLVIGLEESIKRAITYESLFWLKQPNGEVISPTSVNLRSPIEMISNCGFPGTFLAAIAFPEANGLIDMLPYNAENYSYGTTMPHIGLNKPELARKIIEAGLIVKDTSTKQEEITGSWVPRLYEAYAHTERVTEKNIPPIYEVQKVWDLDGTTAMKKNGWYVLTPYAVRTSDGSKRSGLPAAIWNEELGAILTSMNLSASDISQSAHSRLEIITEDGTYKTEHENGSFSWLVYGESFKITQEVGTLGTAEIITEINDSGLNLKVLFTNTSDENIENAYVVLPINVSNGDTTISNDILTYTVGDSTMQISCSGLDWAGEKVITNAGYVRELKIPVTSGISSNIEFVLK